MTVGSITTVEATLGTEATSGRNGTEYRIVESIRSSCLEAKQRESG